jgi:hypothetical protein
MSSNVNADSEYNNRIGFGAPVNGKLIMSYERRLPFKFEGLNTSLGVDVSWQYRATESAFYRDDVTFESYSHVVNPWIMFYLNEEAGIVPNVFIIKPSLIILDPGADHEDIRLFPAYEVMVGHVFNYKRFYFKVDYGFKYFFKSEKVSYSGEDTYFPKKKWTPSAAFYLGFNF